ncbi:MAG TPA: 3-ketosteroid-9-alpha-hydroxylase, partial [Nocardioides sp.]|nr:3-ketosteroid-9-alpha-hydroxylase [Nocardioides sp.]
MPEKSYELTVAEVRRETHEAVSLVLDVRAEHEDAFRFAAGQFLTLGIPSATGLVARCYSLCVPPGEPLTVTVKRTEGGY